MASIRNLLRMTVLALPAIAVGQAPQQCAYGMLNDGCPRNQHCQSGVCVPNATKPTPLEAQALLRLEGGTVATSAGRYTNVKLGADRLPLVVYNSDGAGGIVRAQHCSDAACSSMTASNISDQALTGSGKGRFIDLAMGSDNLPLVVWAGPYIHVAWCPTPTCASSKTRILHQAKGAYPSIAIGADGKPRVAYYLETGALQLATCADLHCMETVASTTLLASGAGVGKYPSVGICQGGLPCVAYQDSAKGHLMFVTCTDKACTAASTPVTIDDASDELGTYISMKIGIDGRPVMMYADERSGAIKVARCIYADCSAGAASKMPVDFVGVGCYGEFPELGISPLNGFPILSYFNQTSKTSGGLRITQCGDADCIEPSLRTSQTVLTGKCGFGRDASIAVGGTRQEPTVFVSLLDYNGNGQAKRASLAILKPAVGATRALRGEQGVSSPWVSPPDGGKDDICKSDKSLLMDAL